MAIKHVLLDLDDTVFDFKRSEHIAICDTLRHFGVEPTEQITERYSEINKECWKALEEGLLSREQILVLRFERLFLELGVKALPIEARRFYEARLGDCAFFIDGAEALIAELRGKYTLSIASNGTAAVQDRRIARAGIAHLFNHIFISEKIGFNKPSRKFFDYCLEALGNPPRSEVIIVGDSLSSDIKGGLSVGIHTCLYNPKGVGVWENEAPEFTVRELSEVAALIASIK